MSPALIHWLRDLVLLSSTPVIALANFALLLFPTFLVGSTLPLLTSYLNQLSSNTGENIGWLYFTNTIGAAVSCLMMGFVFFYFIGLSQVIYVAGCINIMIALMVFALYVSDKKKTRGKQWLKFSMTKLAITLSFLSGFLSLALEVIWIRLFGFFSGGLPQVFAFTLALFLIGISIGSLVGKDICKTITDGQKLIDKIGYYLLLATAMDLFVIVS